MRPSEFQNPPMVFRPAPFWAINDRVTPAEIARQMAGLIAAGFSGAFFHARPGLVTDYLGPEWFAAVAAALESARKHDGCLWLYDDDCWPSGNMGGQVSAIKDGFRAASLSAELLAPGEPVRERTDTVIRAAYAVIREGVQLRRVEQLARRDLVSADTERLIIRHEYFPKIWCCWGNESLANLLDPEVVEAFIRGTHEAYHTRFAAEFGKRIPAIFTDEPACGHSNTAFPWYERMPELYGQWHDRDYWVDLPYLFFDGTDCRHIRLLMHRAVHRQFCEAFSCRIYNWCKRCGIAHTGHYMGEGSIREQIFYHCGSVMAHYRHMQIPGIDHVGCDKESEFLALRQVSSAARQLGRKRVLTELFAAMHHACTFEQFKLFGDYHLVHGANFFCPHLSWYSMRGRRKRDYPPTWSYQQTYWPYLRSLTDYFTRVGYALTRGKAAVDVLVLHPMDTGAAGRRLGVGGKQGWGEDIAAAARCDNALRHVLKALLNAGRDCDLGDEEYLADFGKVAKKDLVVGAMRYRVVIVPPSVTWRKPTFALLEQFTGQGGKLIFAGETPTELDGEPAAEAWQDLVARAAAVVPCADREIRQAVERCAPARFRLCDPDGESVPDTFVQRRIAGRQQIFFIVNSDAGRTQPYLLTLRDMAGQPLAVWNPVDGAQAKVSGRDIGADLQYAFTLAPAGSLLLVAGPDACPAGKPRMRTEADLSAGKVIALPAPWEFRRTEDNVLVADRFAISVDDGASWWPEDADFRQRLRLMRHFGTQGMQECQPWAAIRKRWYEGKGGPIVVRYRFQCGKFRPRRAFLVLEHFKGTELRVNGRSVDLSNAGWHWDRTFGKVEITGLVQPGENVVEHRVHYDFLAEIEPVYVTGDFAVRLDAAVREAEIGTEPARLANGSWVGQGYPFYTGNIVYRAVLPRVPSKAGRVFLRLVRPLGTLFNVWLNGNEVGRLLWRPYRLELTEALGKGANLLEIEVVASLQNTFGAIHQRDGADQCGDQFENKSVFRTEFSLYDYGLLSGAELVVVKRP